MPTRTISCVAQLLCILGPSAIPIGSIRREISDSREQFISLIPLHTSQSMRVANRLGSPGWRRIYGELRACTVVLARNNSFGPMAFP